MNLDTLINQIIKDHSDDMDSREMMRLVGEATVEYLLEGQWAREYEERANHWLKGD